MGQTSDLLARCARVAGRGYNVCFVVHGRKSVRYARDLCAQIARPYAVGKGRLHYAHNGRVVILCSSEADWQLKAWRGFVVLDHDFDLGATSSVHPDERRLMRDLRDAVHMQHPEGKYERLAQVGEVADV
ncbi:MAG: hypothetical protein ACSHX3_15830 [Litorimonas sp.]